MGMKTTDIPVENGHCRIMKERKLTSCVNDRNRNTGIIRDGGIKSRRNGSNGSFWAGGILETG